MKKDNIRDYATAAFQYYAKLGKPHKEDLEQKYYDDALKGYLIENDDRKYVKALIQDFHSGKDVLVEIWEVGE